MGKADGNHWNKLEIDKMKNFVVFLFVFLSLPAICDELYTTTITNDCGNTFSYSTVYDIVSFECASGYYLPAGATSCTACPDGYTCVGGTFEYSPNTNQGINADTMFFQDAPGGCIEQFPQSFHAIYEIMSLDCASGYYLPAGATACTACPNGYTCNGGTFEFNPNTSQGLDVDNVIIQNSTGSCSSNYGQSFHAIYEPITINVNFDDGNGNITSMTCDYGDTITIPDTVPTRTGYNFAGWAVRQNEQSNEQ